MRWDGRILHVVIPAFSRDAPVNKRCCNPTHLLPGTQSANAIDAVKRGSVDTALSPDEVREIRQRADAGEMQKHIAEDYGLSQSFVSEVVNRKKYAWVE